MYVVLVVNITKRCGTTLLVPLRVISIDPIGLSTADARGVCRCDDGFDYVMKDGKSHPQTPHNEWFCTSLCSRLGIATPTFAPLEMPDGTLIFGSRWEGGILDESWWEIVGENRLKFDDIRIVLCRIYVIDHFLFNDDRHLKNYLFREQRGVYGLLAFDFSRAWTYHNFPPVALPFPDDSKTVMTYRFLANKFGSYIDYSIVDEMLQRIESFSVDQVEDVLKTQPSGWISLEQSSNILEWWCSPHKLARLEGIRQGIRDGSYL